MANIEQSENRRGIPTGGVIKDWIPTSLTSDKQPERNVPYRVRTLFKDAGYRVRFLKIK